MGGKHSGGDWPFVGYEFLAVPGTTWIFDVLLRGVDVESGQQARIKHTAAMLGPPLP